MKKNIYIVLSAFSLLVLSCDRKEDIKINKNLEIIDKKISSEIDHLKDTLKSKHENTTVNDQFKKVTLDKKFTTIDGNLQTFESILLENKGKTIVIDIWASWCPDCIKGIPSIEEMQEQYPDAAYIFLSLDKTEEAWRAALEKYDLKGSHYYLNEKMNDEFGRSIDLDWIPRYIIVNKDGKIVDYKSIAADDKTFLFTLKKSEKIDK